MKYFFLADADADTDDDGGDAPQKHTFTFADNAYTYKDAKSTS